MSQMWASVVIHVLVTGVYWFSGASVALLGVVVAHFAVCVVRERHSFASELALRRERRRVEIDELDRLFEMRS